MPNRSFDGSALPGCAGNRRIRSGRASWAPSYGGYAALAGVAIQSDVYRCAVSVAGISDLAISFAGSSARYVRRQNPGCDTAGAVSRRERSGDKRLDAISPLRHADQIKVPLMLIHDAMTPLYPTIRAPPGEGTEALCGALSSSLLWTEDHYLSHSAPGCNAGSRRSNS